VQVQAVAKYVRFSAQKGRLVANQIRGKSALKALELLEFSTKRAAKVIAKVLSSAIANAEHNANLDIDELFINAIYVNEGPTFKRFRAQAKGRGARRLKRSCHITVKVSDKIGE